ncbi:lachesin-like isoform X2 [Rhodnius prolixus]
MDRQVILSIHKDVVSKESRYRVEQRGDTWSLKIANIKPADQGIYMCQVNTNPMISQVGYMDILVPPNIVDSDSTPSWLTVAEGDDVLLICKAEGRPRPVISWRREDYLPIRTQGREVLVYQGSVLSLTRVGRSDMASYFCIASNSVPPSVSKRITLQVHYLPRVRVGSQLIGAPVGSRVTLSCTWEGSPRPVVVWESANTVLAKQESYDASEPRQQANQEQLPESRLEIVLGPLTREYYRTYICTASNSLGRAQAAVRIYEIPIPSQQTRMSSMGSRGNGNSANISRFRWTILVLQVLAIVLQK